MAAPRTWRIRAARSSAAHSSSADEPLGPEPSPVAFAQAMTPRIRPLHAAVEVIYFADAPSRFDAFYHYLKHIMDDLIIPLVAGTSATIP
jgi:hypothetical protein